MTFTLRQLFVFQTLIAVYVAAACVDFKCAMAVHFLYAVGFVCAAVCEGEYVPR